MEKGRESLDHCVFEWRKKENGNDGKRGERKRTCTKLKEKQKKGEKRYITENGEKIERKKRKKKKKREKPEEGKKERKTRERKERKIGNPKEETMNEEWKEAKKTQGRKDTDNECESNTETWMEEENDAVRMRERR